MHNVYTSRNLHTGDNRLNLPLQTPPQKGTRNDNFILATLRRVQYIFSIGE